MATVAMFHSVLGVRPGVRDAARHLRDAGHSVTVVDQYDGRVFDEYDTALEFADSIGYPELMRRAVAGVEELPDGFICLGFSNGAGMAEYVATQRAVHAVVLISGALPLDMLGGAAWPPNVPVQLHSPMRDRFRNDEWIARLRADVGRHAPFEAYEYPVSGHLFMDASLPDEFDAAASDVLWTRVDAFCASCFSVCP